MLIKQMLKKELNLQKIKMPNQKNKQMLKFQKRKIQNHLKIKIHNHLKIKIKILNLKTMMKLMKMNKYVNNFGIQSIL